MSLISESDRKIRVGVIGVGYLGLRHLEHLLGISEAEVVGFFDVNVSHANEVATKTGAKAFQNLSSLIDECEALSIVVPTVDHHKVGVECIKAGKHVFIEKPICSTVDQANELISLAKGKNVITQVGHVERLNPALIALTDIQIDPKYIETHRLAPYNVRGTDVPVVLDLMIHDLDIILSLVKSPIVSIDASGVRIITETLDVANARITFENGCVANITSSRIATSYSRKLRIFQDGTHIVIDFLRQTAELYRVIDANVKDPKAIFAAPLDRNGIHRQIVYKELPVNKLDALKMELENFVSSVKGNSKPIVSGEDATEALRVATIIQQKIKEGLH